MEENVIELSSDSSAPPSPTATDADGFLGFPSGRASKGARERPSKPAPRPQDDLVSVSDVEEGLGLSPSQRRVHCVSDSDESVVAVESEDLTGNDCDDRSHKDVARKRLKAPNPALARRRERRGEEQRRKELERQCRLQDRERRRMELQLDKAVKAAVAEQARALKPGECLKHIGVQLDSVLLTEVYGEELSLALQRAEIQYKVQAMVIPRMVAWTRKVPQHRLGDGLEELQLNRTEDVVEEDEVLVVQPWSETVQLVHSGELCTHVQALKTVLPGKRLTVVVYGMDQYFRDRKARKNKEFRGRVLGLDSVTLKGRETWEPLLGAAPDISHQQLEEALVQVQLFAACNHRLVESPSAFGALVAQFSKAIAERPYKLKKQHKEQEKCDWFAAADSKDCVRVDKSGNGLLRLWKQHLCQFNLASLETAEAIASKYQSPQALIQAYSRCTSQQNAELLLQDIQIRRALGPLTSMRRVGPELSKKVHRFFTTESEESPPSQE